MNEHHGWLLDAYADENDGLVLWLLTEDGSRLRLHQSFPVCYYVAGPAQRLRQLWTYLRRQRISVHLDRVSRRDLFLGPLDVLSICTPNPILHERLFRATRNHFPDLDFYDADIPVALRLAAATDLFPLARCQALAAEDGRILEIHPLHSHWELEPSDPPLRILCLEPDCDPAQGKPVSLILRTERENKRIPLQPTSALIIRLGAALRRVDPDLILTRWGDTWLFPLLIEVCRKANMAHFNLNRDEGRQPLQRSENSFFTYGRVVYRGRQVLLFGRWHIDEKNAVMFGAYGLTGVLEQARITGLPVQEVARKSPGAGITAMQMRAALKQGILVPFQKQQAEDFKSAGDLVRADRGGLVYQPLVGLHRNVAEIDFVSMYPSIMVQFNISPETVGMGEGEGIVPDLGIAVDQRREGLVPAILRPLLARRVAMKQRLAALNRLDCRYGPLKARSDALKWLLVVSFGYLGYKNARFGRIESHEAVTAYSREALLRAKEAAEALGYTVLHMFVDGLWVKRPDGALPGDLDPLLKEVTARTGLPIALDGVYRWLAFLPSRLDRRVPVPNRYFGLLRDGRLKIRGIEARRHDTPPFVAQAQLAMLNWLARLPDDQPLDTCLADLVSLLQRRLRELRAGRIALEKLLVTQTLSRELSEYRVPSPAARAAAQLVAAGKNTRPGQRVRFIYTRGEPDVWAWDQPIRPEPEAVDAGRYAELLVRAAWSIVQPLDADQRRFREWVLYDSFQRCFGF